VRRRGFLVLIVGAVLAVAPGGGRSVSAEDFYQGKTINLLIGHEAGGEYDTHARLIARYLSLHIPGTPTIVPQNMIGASGLRATNFLYNSAPRDGTTIAMVAENILQNQKFGQSGVQYDAARLYWIGSMTRTAEIVITWHATGIKNVEDARRREVVIGTSTKLTMHYVMATLMNEFLGTKFKTITGYTGGNGMNLAVERGEVDARVIAWSALKTDKPQWIAEKKVNILAQLGPSAPDLAEVPNVQDLVATAQERELIELFTAANRLGRPLATAPETPQDRVRILRTAFDATMKDAGFLADARAAHIDVNPVRGVDMQEEASRVLATPAATVQRAKTLIE
jgi:ABC-type phosphate/phosphonate transport system substrate-binding protein